MGFDILAPFNIQIQSSSQASKSSPYFETTPSSATLLAGQSMQVHVRYSPKAMGCHTATLPFHGVSKGKDVQCVGLMVSGSSLMQAAPSKTLVGGADKLPRDFEKQRAYVDDDQVGGE